MIISKTPFRMSFFGGGTDIENYFRDRKGSVISTTFDKYCYVNVRHLPRFFTYSNEFVYSEIERVSSVDEIRHPAIREAMKLMNMQDIRLSYDADLPARSGLGTSSSFAVGMLNAFYALKGKYADKQKLAEDAIYLERTLCNEAGGWQDQIAVAYGGLNRIDFGPDGFSVNPVIISPDKKNQLNESLMLFFTGFSRNSAKVQEANNIAGNSKSVAHLDEMVKLVDEAERILEDRNRNLDDFGRLLDENWKLKKSLGSSISTSNIDEIYEVGKNSGALGGKLLGAGGGGFILFYVHPEDREQLRQALNNLIHVPFKFETGGTRILYYTPEPLEEHYLQS